MQSEELSEWWGIPPTLGRQKEILGTVSPFFGGHPNPFHYSDTYLPICATLYFIIIFVFYSHYLTRNHTHDAFPVPFICLIFHHIFISNRFSNIAKDETTKGTMIVIRS